MTAIQKPIPQASQDNLIVFVKNPVLGKVKTRIAEEIGDEKALAIYKRLLKHTQNVCCQLSISKNLFYNQYIDTADSWNNTIFKKQLQFGKNLGEKMHNAITKVSIKANKIVLIGSDNIELTSAIIESAFSTLDDYDVVVGPANDGGYYLIGMKQSYQIFNNIEWSTEKVLAQTILQINQQGLTYQLLTYLNDIDHMKDWVNWNTNTKSTSN